MSAGERLKAKRRRARERARPRAAKPTGPARARAVDRKRSTEPSWARPSERDEQAAADGDGYQAWMLERATGMSPLTPRVTIDWMGHAHVRPAAGINLFGWRV